MFPTLPIRLLATATIFLGAWVWTFAVPALSAPDGSLALTILMSHGVAGALLMLLLAGLPAIVLSVICSSVGNPLCGLFTLATCLWVLSAQGSPITAWIHRTDASLPGDYFKFAAEVLIWTVFFVAFMHLVRYCRERTRKMIPILAAEPHLGEELTVTSGWLPSIVRGAITAILGGVLGYFLIRSPDKGQVIGGLMLAFMIAALVGDFVATQLFRRHPANPIGLILAPAVVALVAYLLTAIGYSGSKEYLEAVFNLRLSGLALALPIDYASAGIAGCALGAGWSQVMQHQEEPALATAPAAEA